MTGKALCLASETPSWRKYGCGMPKPTEKKSKGIVSWPEDERPRERLITRGPHALTDAELIAILLRVGVTGKSAIELGRDLLSRFGSIRNMMTAPLAAWQEIKGLGKAKVAQLHAALELGRRAALPGAGEKSIIKRTRQAADYFTVRLRGLAEEHFRVAYLSRQGRLLEDALLAAGTVLIRSVHISARSSPERSRPMPRPSLRGITILPARRNRVSPISCSPAISSPPATPSASESSII